MPDIIFVLSCDLMDEIVFSLNNLSVLQTLYQLFLSWHRWLSLCTYWNSEYLEILLLFTIFVFLTYIFLYYYLDAVGHPYKSLLFLIVLVSEIFQCFHLICFLFTLYIYNISVCFFALLKFSFIFLISLLNYWLFQQSTKFLI